MQPRARRHLEAIDVDVRAVVRARAHRVHSRLGDGQGAVKRHGNPVKVRDTRHLGKVAVVRKGNVCDHEGLLGAEAGEAREGPDVVAAQGVGVPPGAVALGSLALEDEAPQVLLLGVVAVALGARVASRRHVDMPVVGVGSLVRHNDGRAPPILKEGDPRVVLALCQHDGAAAPSGRMEAPILDEELAVNVDIRAIVRRVTDLIPARHVDHDNPRKHHGHVIKAPQLVVGKHVPQLVVPMEPNRQRRLGGLRHQLAEVGKVAHLVPAVGVIVGLHAPAVPARALWCLHLAVSLKPDRRHHSIHARCVGSVVSHLEVGPTAILEKVDEHRVVAAREVPPAALGLPLVVPGARCHLLPIHVDTRTVVRGRAHLVHARLHNLHRATHRQGHAVPVLVTHDALERGIRRKVDAGHHG
mmetsp:Transcript_24242/g.61003  ORF Transcript_24242/g.61003 Transcript_24242/m.61003 type:complete len:413 (+) Transcript_24242:3362-4600(+)